VEFLPVRKDSIKPEEPDPRQLSLLPEPVIEQPRCSDERPWEKYLTKEPQPETESEKEETKAPKPQLGKLIRLPMKSPEDPMLRLEQNFGCELPVCVSNRRDVKKEAIEITIGDATAWQLMRTARGSLPAPEHYRFWLWFLDRCQAAAIAGCDRAPRISLNPPELYELFGGKKGGTWYREIDEAFTRFSELVIKVHDAYHTPKGAVVEHKATLGTLCYYVSWRTKKPNEKQELLGFEKGWVAPGPLLWASICGGYLKAVPLPPMRRLPSYISQRLLVYLMKHCSSGGQYKVSLSKMLPKLPMDCSPREARRKLAAHHRSLLEVGFLAREPIFEGRGPDLMVTYERS
jgi:hypothetical protein